MFLDGYIELQQYKKNAILELYSIKIKRNNGHYCYSSKNDVDFNENIRSTKSNLQNIHDIFYCILKDIENYYLKICKETEKKGYSYIEYEETDEELNDIFECNEVYFLENGKIYK